MIWTGLVAGILLGAWVDGFEGAVVGGFLGCLTGVIVKSQRARPVAPAQATAAAETLEARVARLERAVASLEARLAQAGVAATGPMPSAAIAPPAEAPAPAGLQRFPSEPPADQPVAAAPGRAPAHPSRHGQEPRVGPPAPPPEPPRPNPIMAWLTGGNTIARVGLVILFIGLAFLLKYAADHAMFPIELRVASVAAAGIAMLAFGWRWRARRPAYALGLQGGGIAVLYLTTFAALRLWALIPAEAAFVLLAGIAVFSAILAIRQDSTALAVTGVGGGFLAPILASTGGGSHVALFGYYLLLNLGIAAVAWHKAWRGLNLLGFGFTFFIGLAWGWRFYRPEHFATIEPFLVAFFLLYLAIAILYARKQDPDLRHLVDGTLVFGNPLAAFGLQAALVKGMEFGLAFSALAVAAIYLVLAAVLKRVGQARYGLLSEAFLALGAAFASAAIPFALDARWTSAAWAVEGAAIAWIGLRQERRLARAFGVLLQLLAGGAFLHAHANPYFLSLGAAPLQPVAAGPLLHPVFVGAVLIAAAGFVTHRLLTRYAEMITDTERVLAKALFGWALLWWLFAGVYEIDRVLETARAFQAVIGFVAATALGLWWLGTRRGWSEALRATRLYVPVLALLAIIAIASPGHPFLRGGWIAWPVAAAVHFAVLRRQELARNWSLLLHVGGALALAGVATDQLHWFASTHAARHTAWSAAALGFMPAFVVLLTSLRALDARWPIAAHGDAYRRVLPAIVATLLGAWSLFVNVSHGGSSDPLPYLPLLNALDLAHVFVAMVLVFAWLAWQRSEARAAEWPDDSVIAIAGGVLFVWLNAVLLRTLHHWAGVPYTFDGITRSVLAQAALSVFWAVLALAAMLYASRSQRRTLWMVGGALMAVVVAKLLVVDLARLAGIERIVSFIVVGLLMLVIGYISPVPPRSKEAA